MQAAAPKRVVILKGSQRRATSQQQVHAHDAGIKRQQQVVGDMLTVTLPEKVTVKTTLVNRIHGVGGAEPLFADAPNQKIQITQAFADPIEGRQAGQRAKFICPWKPAPKMDPRYPDREFSGFFYLCNLNDPKLAPISDSSIK